MMPPHDSEPRHSRLARMIDRLTAQRAFLEAAAGLIGDRPGPVLEIGLGKGRTYDHLRRLLPSREIFAFDGSLHAPADVVPDTAHLIIGNFWETLPRARATLPAPAALAHADVGTEDAAADAAQARWLGPMIDALMAEGGIVVADRPMTVPRWQALEGPETAWPYHLWRIG